MDSHVNLPIITGCNIVTALNLFNENEIEECDKKSVGSMKAKNNGEHINLPTEVYDVVDWLRNDKLREIKAEPVLSYYQDLYKALQESYRVLHSSGVAIYVIGKESVFYRFKTRQILKKVMCDQIFSEIARNIGFDVEKQIDIQLDKRNRNARPRSLDSYFETAFILRKNA